jgi:hypothetical protein
MFRLHKLAIFRPHMKHSSQTLSTELSRGYYLHCMIYKYIIKLKLKLKIIHWKALLRDKIYVPTGCVLLIVLSMWSIIVVEESALGCWCPSFYVEWCGVCFV